MKRIPVLWAILLFISVDYAVGQANITGIRFGSTGDPLNGVTIAWNSRGTADSIAWGRNDIRDATIELDMYGQQKGIYVVKVRTAKRSETFRLILQ